MDAISPIDRAHIRQFRRNYGSTYIVVARLGDALFQQGRARGIWAAYTASAASQSGLRSLLVVGRSELPFRLETQGQETNADRILRDFYGARGEVDIVVLNEINRAEQDLEVAQRAAIREFSSRTDLNGFCHTRDPALVRWCSQRGPAFVYEDHGEDYHDAARPELRAHLNSPGCRLIIAITPEIASRLVAAGAEPSKVEVHPSASSIDRNMFSPEEIDRCRAFHLQDGYEKLIVYAGGVQEERGIAHILSAARKMPTYKFMIVGGHSGDLEAWQQNLSGEGPANLCWTGYLPLPDSVLLELAADLLLATRQNSDRMKISSPLKIFEYLRTGTPIVSYTKDFENLPSDPALAIATYDPVDPDTLVDAIESAVCSFPRNPLGYAQNVAIGERFSWERRFMRIIRSVNSREGR